MYTHTKPIILVVDDETAILKTLKQALEDENYHVATLSDGNRALDSIGKLLPDLILLDIFMPNCNGLELLSQIKIEYPHQKVIMISGFGNIAMAIQALKKGALDFIEKPLSLDEILPKLEFLQTQPEKKALPEKKISHKQQGLIGKSYTFLELLRQATTIAPLPYPIIIQGEPGTGKATLARYIHKKSGASPAAYYEINCTHQAQTITQNITSVLCAPKGTLFLCHIDKLSSDRQAYVTQKLLTSPYHRIIASTTKSLFRLYQDGTFNQSLFYQLNIVPLEIPPLRKHAYDIPLLTDHFLEITNKALGKSVRLTISTMRLLRNKPWQGNIAELKSVIQKIVSFAPEQEYIIKPENLVEYLGEKQTDILPEQSFSFFTNLKEATASFEKNFLLYLLKKNHCNLDEVSSYLSMTKPQLRNKLLELKIDTRFTTS